MRSLVMIVLLIISSYAVGNYNQQLSNSLLSEPGNEEWSTLLKHFIGATGFSDAAIQKYKDAIGRMILVLENNLEEYNAKIVMTKFGITKPTDLAHLPSLELIEASDDGTALKLRITWDTHPVDIAFDIVGSSAGVSFSLPLHFESFGMSGMILLQLPSSSLKDLAFGWYDGEVPKLSPTIKCHHGKVGHIDLRGMCTKTVEHFEKTLVESIISSYTGNWVHPLPDVKRPDGCDSYADLEMSLEYLKESGDPSSNDDIAKAVREMTSYRGIVDAAREFTNQMRSDLRGYKEYAKLSKSAKEKPIDFVTDVCFCPEIHHGATDKFINHHRVPKLHKHISKTEAKERGCTCFVKHTATYVDPMVGLKIPPLKFSDVSESVNKEWGRLMKSIFGVTIFPLDSKDYYLKTINIGAQKYVDESSFFSVFKLRNDLKLPSPADGPAITMMDISPHASEPPLADSFLFKFEYDSEANFAATFETAFEWTFFKYSEVIHINKIKVSGEVILKPPTNSLNDLAIQFTDVPELDIGIVFDVHKTIGSIIEAPVLEALKWAVSYYAVKQPYKLAPSEASSEAADFCTAITFAGDAKKYNMVYLRFDGNDLPEMIEVVETDFERYQTVIEKGNQRLEDLYKMVKTKYNIDESKFIDKPMEENEEGPMRTVDLEVKQNANVGKKKKGPRFMGVEGEKTVQGPVSRQ